MIYKPELDICLFTGDVTVKSSRLYISLENEIHLRSERYQYYRCLMACAWNIALSKNVAHRM